MASARPPQKQDEKTVAATHRKARHFYEILEVQEAGLCLTGAEVKSLRGGRASLDGCFARCDGDELFLHNFYIPPYALATSGPPPEPRRPRKLLMRRREIDKLAGRLQTKGLTLVPLEVYFRRGWAKVALAVARGKAGPDRREDIKRRAQTREAEKSFKGKYKG